MKRRLKHGLLALGAICLVFLIDNVVRGPRATAHQKLLLETLHSIPDVSDASVISSGSSNKTSNGSADRRLVSGLPVSEVRMFYVNELRERGWNTECERYVGDRDRIVLTRDQDTAVLDLPKLDSRITGEFSLQLSWGIRYC